MNSSPQVVSLYARLLLALLSFAIALGLLVRGASNAKTPSFGSTVSSPQKNEEKSLNIERYPNEPFELVDIKIGSTSIKNLLKSKLKDNRSKMGMDNAKFRDDDDWSKKVKLRLRNISGRPIYGMSASIFFEHHAPRVAFELPLKRLQHSNVKNDPLQPRDEIDLEVAESSFTETMAKITRYGLNPSELMVVVAVRSAFFSDDFGWFGGSFMRRDPNNPQKWDAVDQSGEPPEANRLEQSVGFIVVGFNFIASAPQSSQTCQQQRAGFFGYPCGQDRICYRVEQIGNGSGGYLSDFPAPGYCKRNPEQQTEEDCAEETINNYLLIDFTCSAPSPTPPLSCLPDGYVYYGDIPCCSGHDYVQLPLFMTCKSHKPKPV